MSIFKTLVLFVKEIVREVSLVAMDKNRLKTTGTNEVLKIWGVRPEQIGQLISLMGDSADGIPGVPGIGPKTAALLLRRYGDLPELLSAAKAP